MSARGLGRSSVASRPFGAGRWPIIAPNRFSGGRSVAFASSGSAFSSKVFPLWIPRGRRLCRLAALVSVSVAFAFGFRLCFPALLSAVASSGALVDVVFSERLTGVVVLAEGGR